MMGFITDTPEYREKMKKLLEKKKSNNEYECYVNLISDTSLVYFLTTKYPEVWNEYLESRKGHNTINELIEEMTKR